MKNRRIKKKKIHINKIKKRMRQLERKNRKDNRVGKTKKETELLSSDVYEFLEEVNFGDISIGDKLSTKSAKGIVSIKIPPIFSMTKNPEETIVVFKKIYYYCGKDSIKEIIFDHKECEELEIAASTIMDTIVMACKLYRKSIGKELIVGGNFPKNQKCRKILTASGLPAHLVLQEKIPSRKDNVKLFSLVGGKSGTGRSGSVATSLTDYFNECLETQDYELTLIGQNMISKMFGEVIENCEIHGGENTSWYVLGHFDMIERKYGEVNLVIFNYGKSIYQQLIGPDTTEETRTKIEYMKDIHKTQYDKNWTEESMLTVFTLQKGISRLRDQNVEGNKKRGTGTFRLLNTFYTLGQSEMDVEPEFSITSGHTHILFDNKYKLAETNTAPEVLEIDKANVIAFNETNDLLKKADVRNVTIMDQYFPGTIISMKFYIDRKYLQSL